MTPTIQLLSANKRSVSDVATDLPDMREAITGWFRPITLVRVFKKVVDHETQENRMEVRCKGMVQPFGPRELKMKPEGQRQWNWQMLHTTPDVQLRDDEEFTIKDTRYRVMSQQNWSEYGYVLYELVQDYQNGR